MHYWYVQDSTDTERDTWWVDIAAVVLIKQQLVKLCDLNI